MRYDTLPTDTVGPNDAEEAEIDQSEWGPSDVAAAVQRQGKFIANMEKIGWLDHGASDVLVIDLIRGIVRYRKCPLPTDWLKQAGLMMEQMLGWTSCSLREENNSSFPPYVSRITDDRLHLT